MIILCIEPVAKTMSMIFRTSKTTDTFPDIWKGSNIILVYREANKQIDCLWKTFGEGSGTKQLDPSKFWKNQLDPSKS